MADANRVDAVTDPPDLPCLFDCLVRAWYAGSSSLVASPSADSFRTVCCSILLEGRSCVSLGTVSFSPSLLPAVTPRSGHKILCTVVQRHGWTSEVGFELAGPWVPQHEIHVPITVVFE